MQFILQHYAIFIPLVLALLALGLGVFYRYLTLSHYRSHAVINDYGLIAKLSLFPLVVGVFSLLVIVYLFTTIESSLYVLEGLYFDQNILDTLMGRYRKSMLISGITFLLSIHLSYFLGLLGFILRGKKIIPLISIIGSMALFSLLKFYLMN